MRRVTQALSPFLVNPLNALDYGLIFRIDKEICYLSRIENRALYIFDTFPLTFNSVATVSVFYLFIHNSSIDNLT